MGSSQALKFSSTQNTGQYGTINVGSMKYVSFEDVFGGGQTPQVFEVGRLDCHG